MDLNYALAGAIREFANIEYLTGFIVASAEYGAYFIPPVLVYLFLRAGTDRFDSLFVFFTTVLSIQLSHLAGLLYYHPRPFVIYETLLTAYPDNSFPSQHAATMFAFAAAFTYRKRYKISTFFISLAVLNSFARISVGFHFPIDIIGGIIISAIALYLLTKLEKYVKQLSDYLDLQQTKIISKLKEKRN